MPAGKFPPQEIAAARKQLDKHLEANAREFDMDETRLSMAISFIHAHITNEHTPQNEDLINAVSLIVGFARKHGHLKR